ncbi:carboxymuconolactone decarboxylase family protein [Amycolatopsis acidicola]|uniref:Carboxymuconolactone decarboxylase family protein n=1 Tax=Amycolatopsis acidicola TaxID=2596893 RepID=A0A5N0V437_9PSEU|nr:carboxymuconolactone decarboxylase family protein [Amycolatopsis acidicola]KAA9159804.1 carboxymuconolactone decarboxylase family protein [Amycolatopsis acidicola]
MARITPLPQSDWSAEMAEFIVGFRSAARGGVLDESRPAGANLLGTMARYPGLSKAFLAFNGHVLNGSTLSRRDRELLVLRVAAVRQCDYEWAQHTLLAREAGFTDEEIARIAEGSESSGWPERDTALLKSVDELLGGGKITAPTWRVLAGEFDERQLMDLVFTVGTYAMLAMALRSFEIEPEDELVPHLPVR